MEKFKKFFSTKALSIVLASAASIFGIIFVSPMPALAVTANGDVAVTVTREASQGALAGATLNIICGAMHSGATASYDAGVYTVTAATIAAWGDCPNTTDMTVIVEKDGYKSLAAGNFAYQTGSGNDVTISNVQYSYTITGITSEALSANLTATATTVELGDVTGLNACVFDTATWYCPVVLANSDGTLIAHIAHDGYVEKSNYATTDLAARLANNAVQDTGTVASIQYAVKVIADDETIENDNVTGATIQAGGTSCSEAGGSGVYYCAVPLVTLGTNTIFQKDGYVQKEISNSYNDRAVATDAQQIVGLGGAVTTAVNLQFSQKVTATKEASQGALTGAAVTAGDADTACDEDGSTGIYYCPVPVAQDTGPNNIKITLSGYVYNATGDTVDRAAQTTAQGEVAVSGIQYAYTITGITSQVLAADLTATATTVQLGDDTALNACVFDTATWYCPVVLTNSDGTLIARIAKDGYVEKSNYATTGLAARNANSDAQDTGTVAGIEYSYKITNIGSEVLLTDVTATATTVELGDDTALNACAFDTATWYCPVVLANSDGTLIAHVAHDGYVEKSNYATTGLAARNASTDAQDTGMVAVQYTYTISGITTEVTAADITATATTVELGDATALNACAFDTATWYCPVVAANSNQTLIARVVKDGYVEKLDYATTGLATRSAATDIQDDGTVTNIQFSQKVTVTKEASQGALAGAAVTAGDADTSCTEDGSTGIYYCPVPVAQDTGPNNIKITLSGYVYNATGDTVDRAAQTTAQGEVAVSGIQYAYTITGITSQVLAADLTATATTVQLGDDTALNACVFDTATWYCPVVLTNSDGTLIARIAKDGYVEKSNYATTGLAARNANSDAQDTGTVAGIEYSYKISGIGSEVLVADLTATATTVELGDDTALNACAFDTATWYCPVVLANSDGTLIAHVAKDGYVEKSNYETSGLAARNASTDAQDTGTVGNVQYTYKITGIAMEATSTDITATATTVELGDATALNTCTFDTATWYCPVVAANSNATLIAHIALDGVVEKSNYATTGLATRSAATDAQDTGTVGNVQYTYTISGITSEVLAADLTATATTVELGDATALNACTFNTATWYCPVAAANSNQTLIARIVKDGYVEKLDYATTGLATRSAATDAQDDGTVASVQYAYKITGIASEALAADLTATATTVQLGDATALNACTFNTATWYCPVILANSDGTIIARIAHDGYVEKSNYATTGLAARGSNDAVQDTGTVASVQYALKVTVIREGDSVAVAGSTVTAGNSYGTTCTEDGSTGIHYCAIPLANTGVLARIVNSGYTTKYLTYTDRTVSTGAQGTSTATLVTPAPQGAGTLAVTRIDSVKSFATNDNAYPTSNSLATGGWRWIFNVTVPTSETNVKMKFNDFVNGSSVLPVTSKLKYYSSQSTTYSSADAAIQVSGNEYASSATALDIDAAQDLDANTAGIQIQVTVETKVPLLDNSLAAPQGSYSTSYGVQSTAP